MSLWPRFLAHPVRHRWFQRVSISFSLAQWFSNTYFIRTHISFTISSTCDINTTIFAIFNHFIIINGVSVAMATRLFTFPVCNNVEMGELQKNRPLHFFCMQERRKIAMTDFWVLTKVYQKIYSSEITNTAIYCIYNFSLRCCMLKIKLLSNYPVFSLHCTDCSFRIQYSTNWLLILTCKVFNGCTPR